MFQNLTIKDCFTVQTEAIDMEKIPDYLLGQLPHQIARNLFNMKSNTRLDYFETIQNKMSDDLY